MSDSDAKVFFAWLLLLIIALIATYTLNRFKIINDSTAGTMKGILFLLLCSSIAIIR